MPLDWSGWPRNRRSAFGSSRSGTRITSSSRRRRSSTVRHSGKACPWRPSSAGWLVDLRRVGRNGRSCTDICWGALFPMYRFLIPRNSSLTCFHKRLFLLHQNDSIELCANPVVKYIGGHFGPFLASYLREHVNTDNKVPEGKDRVFLRVLLREVFTWKMGSTWSSSASAKDHIFFSKYPSFLWSLIPHCYAAAMRRKATEIMHNRFASHSHPNHAISRELGDRTSRTSL